jgi:hypothetical protein
VLHVGTAPTDHSARTDQFLNMHKNSEQALARCQCQSLHGLPDIIGRCFTTFIIVHHDSLEKPKYQLVNLSRFSEQFLIGQFLVPEFDK